MPSRAGIRLTMTLLGLSIAVASESKAAFLVQTYESDSRLFSVDPDAGTFSLIGATGVSFLTDLALTSDGSLFASTLGALYAVNPATAASTLIGSFSTTSSMVGLDSAPGGLLFGVDQSGGGFFRIDPTSGAATLLFDTAFSYVGDVAHLAGDIFYATASFSGGSHLVEIDAGAMSATDRGLIASGLDFSGLDFDQTGRLIAFAGNGGNYEITNFATSGAGTLLSTLSGAPPAGGATALPAAVPEPSSLALGGIGVVIGFGGWWRRRRIAFPGIRRG